MIKQWWSGREQREQGLILVAAGLTLGFGLWFGVISPLAEAKAQAREKLSQSIQDKAVIERALARLDASSNVMAEPAGDDDRFRAEIARGAQQSGLALSRVQSGADGTLQLFLQESEPDIIYAWLEDIAQRPGGDVVRATLTSVNDKVEAVVELQGTKP